MGEHRDVPLATSVRSRILRIAVKVCGLVVGEALVEFWLESRSPGALSTSYVMRYVQTRHRMRSSYDGMARAAAQMLMRGSEGNTSATGNSVLELKEQQAAVHGQFDLFMDKLFANPKLFNQSKARDPALWATDADPLVTNWACYEGGVRHLSHVCGGQPNTFTHEVGAFALPAHTLPPQRVERTKKRSMRCRRERMNGCGLS